MSNREILEQIVKDDEIDYISFEDDKFLIKFGDVENTDKDGYKYKLLDSYIEMDYNFNAYYFRLHRGVVDVKECYPQDLERTSPSYNYSGFVHCQRNGKKFCYGGSGIESICAEIAMEGLTSDRFNLLILRFGVYLSNSSHGTSGSSSNYRKVNFGENTEDITVKLKAIRNLDGINYPFVIEKITKNATIEGIDYDKPYKILTHKDDLKFKYMDKWITPIVVQHETVGTINRVTEDIKIDINAILEKIKLEEIEQTKNEVNNTRNFNIKDFIHQFTD